MINQPDIYVYAEYGWTCQLCFATVKGFDSEQQATTDSESHRCEEYS
jgi:hypothetical protein